MTPTEDRPTTTIEALDPRTILAKITDVLTALLNLIIILIDISPI